MAQQNHDSDGQWVSVGTAARQVVRRAARKRMAGRTVRRPAVRRCLLGWQVQGVTVHRAGHG